MSLWNLTLLQRLENTIPQAFAVNRTVFKVDLQVLKKLAGRG